MRRRSQARGRAGQSTGNRSRSRACACASICSQRIHLGVLRSVLTRQSVDWLHPASVRLPSHNILNYRDSGVQVFPFEIPDPKALSCVIHKGRLSPLCGTTITTNLSLQRSRP
jgi:hypothetical protein